MHLFQRQSDILQSAEVWEEIECLENCSNGAAMFEQVIFIERDPLTVDFHPAGVRMLKPRDNS